MVIMLSLVVFDLSRKEVLLSKLIPLPKVVNFG